MCLLGHYQWLVMDAGLCDNILETVIFYCTDELFSFQILSEYCCLYLLSSSYKQITRVSVLFVEIWLPSATPFFRRELPH